MKRLLLLLLFILCSMLSFAQLPLAIDSITLDNTELEIRIVAQDRYIPWDMDWSSDGWLWFSERDGKIMRLRPESGYLEQVFMIEDAFESPENSGLHAMALHPQFPDSPYVYTHFTYTWDGSRIVRYTFDSKRVTLTDRRVLEDSIWASSSHNGSRIVFSPDGQYMFVAIGDGYQSERAQDPYDLNGSILRYKLDGSIPEDNPFPGSPVWSYGHRNPQGLVFGSNGLLYSSEHGTANHDELNIIQKGGNYGWPIVEGLCDLPPEEFACEQKNIVPPLYDYRWTWAVCGTAFYDHPAIPEWRNSLLQTSLKSGKGGSGQRLQVFHLKPEGTVVEGEIDQYFANTFGRLRDVMTTPDGRVFICTSNQEFNGDEVRQALDDKIIEIRNLNLDYEVPPIFEGSPLDLLQIGPVPTLEDVKVRIRYYQGKAKLSLTDLRGSQVWQSQEELNGQTLSIPGRLLGPGLFWLKIELEDGSSRVEKVIFN